MLVLRQRQWFNLIFFNFLIFLFYSPHVLRTKKSTNQYNIAMLHMKLILFVRLYHV